MTRIPEREDVRRMNLVVKVLRRHIVGHTEGRKKRVGSRFKSGKSSNFIKLLREVGRYRNTGLRLRFLKKDRSGSGRTSLPCWRLMCGLVDHPIYLLKIDSASSPKLPKSGANSSSADESSIGSTGKPQSSTGLGARRRGTTGCPKTEVHTGSDNRKGKGRRGSSVPLRLKH